MDHDVRVRGEARLEVPPDRATFSVTVDADGATTDDAYRAAAAKAGAVDAVLEEQAAAIDRASTAGLVVAPLTRWRKGETVRTGWRASRQTVVEMTEFEHLGAVLAHLAAAGAMLDGPTWSIDDANPAFATVRAAASVDARRRATAYAVGLGGGLGEVLWVAEPGLRDGGQGGDVIGGAGHRMYAMAAAADDDVIDVGPKDVAVVATVEVAFALIGGS